jgi:hypothetical protein
MMDAETDSKSLEIHSILTQLTAGLNGRIDAKLQILQAYFDNPLIMFDGTVFLARPFNGHFEMTPSDTDKLITNPCITTIYSALLFLCAAGL